MTERKPQAFTWEEAPRSSRSKVAREPRSIPMSRIQFEKEDTEGELPELQPVLATPSRSRWLGLLISALCVLIVLWAGIGIVELIEELFAHSAVLGWLGAGFAGLAALAAIVIILREAVGLIRLKRLVKIHEDANQALLNRDAEAAGRTLRALDRIYGGRADVRWGLDELRQHSQAVVAPDDRIKLAERDLMGPLDETALGVIARASRRITLVTAITPAAALDILFVAALNLRLLREIATLYGGRPGTLGTFKLARMVVSHLAVTGGLALSDNLVQHVIGRGVLGRLSARFGEGAVNGILTARIGLAAIDLCRPLPFTTRKKPSLSVFIRQLLSFDSASKGAESA
jgi:putative membrane protein